MILRWFDSKSHVYLRHSNFNSKIIEQDGIIISNHNRIRWNIIEGLYKKKGIKESRV